MCDDADLSEALAPERLDDSVRGAGVCGAVGEPVERALPAWEASAPVADHTHDAGEELPVQGRNVLRVVPQKHAHDSLRVADQRAAGAHAHVQDSVPIL